MQEQHAFITKVLYYQPISNSAQSSARQLYNVYTERMLPIVKAKWIPVNTTLSVLKGFRRLSTSFGLMRVTSDMIGMN